MLPMTTAMIDMVAETLVVLDVPAAQDTGTMVNAVYRTVPKTGAPRVLATVRMRSMFQPGSDGSRRTAPFGRRFVSDVGAGGTVAHSDGESYTVHVFPVRGTPWRIESHAPARAVTQADRDSVINQTLKTFRAPTVASLPPQLRAQLDAKFTTFPPYWASFVYCAMARSGFVRWSWLERRRRAGMSSAPRERAWGRYDCQPARA